VVNSENQIPFFYKSDWHRTVPTDNNNNVTDRLLFVVVVVVVVVARFVYSSTSAPFDNGNGGHEFRAPLLASCLLAIELHMECIL
jgi:hypothetical protein